MSSNLIKPDFTAPAFALIGKILLFTFSQHDAMHSFLDSLMVLRINSLHKHAKGIDDYASVLTGYTYHLCQWIKLPYIFAGQL